MHYWSLKCKYVKNYIEIFWNTVLQAPESYNGPDSINIFIQSNTKAAKTLSNTKGNLGNNYNLSEILNTFKTNVCPCP